MSREIKFRFWSLVNHTMSPPVNIYGLLSSPVLRLIGDGTDEMEIMQYTGRKYSDGTEAYEGDLYRINDSDGFYGETRVFEIYWDGTGWNARQHPEFGGYDSDYTQFWLPPIYPDDWEAGDGDTYILASNIYENPELLK